MRDLTRKIKYIWLIGGIILSVIISIPIFLTFLFIDITIISPAAAGLISFAVMASVLSFYLTLRYDAWGYEIKDDHLFLKHGVIKKVKSMVPYVRIQHIDTQRGVIYRITGLSKTVVYTAGSRGADVTIPGLSEKTADELQTHLRKVAIESEEKDAV